MLKELKKEVLDYLEAHYVMTISSVGKVPQFSCPEYPLIKRVSRRQKLDLER